MKISDGCELGNFWISEECDCEHCGNLEPFEITWSDGGTWWCLDCATYNDDYKMTDEFELELKTKMLQLKKEYYETKLKEIENEILDSKL